MISTHSLTFLLANRDFSPVNNRPVIFLPGDTTGSQHCVNITILDDEIVEDNEEFKVVLSSTSDIQIFGITSTNVTIVKDTSDSKIVEYS